ncbi:tigger transposable element-derived protein 6-like [Rhizophagus clarus]|uniref:Tigger transposable element-derived protein 6-like n=1 Tax=Rhizophagus clarus TaxID=94130 RepID=A0A8H3L7Y8_9GLOM|nr:tigger transposable element-derived protein 6-like [Rhizophagus clarus]
MNQKRKSINNKNKEKWLNIKLNSFNTAKQREKLPKFPKLEEALAIWISNALFTNKTIMGEIIIVKAFDFTRLMNIEGFTRSVEAQSGPNEEELTKEREKLQELINNFDLENVFNCDETGLYWELKPSKTLSIGPFSRIKKSKNRITLLLTFNATGSVKLSALFIHKYQTPRDLIGIDKSKLPIDYFWNKKAWMQTSIWNKYLELLNQRMKKRNKKILLLVDNAPVHSISNPELLINITIHYLPSNTTAHLQPADAGIINSFKIPVTSETIHNCWIKTGILPLVVTSPSPSVEKLNNDINLNETEEVQRLLDQYNQYNNFTLGELMSTEEFILIDDDNNYREEEITDEEIVNIIKSNETDLAEEEINLQPKISISEALESLDKVLSFLSNPPDNFVIELNNRNLMHNFKKQIIFFDKNSKVQSVLDSWLNT